MKHIGFRRGADLFMTPTAELAIMFCRPPVFSKCPPSPPPSNIAQLGKTHLQYRAAVVEPLHERRSDTWIIFELAKRMGISEQFFDGDIEAGYAYELAAERELRWTN